MKYCQTNESEIIDEILGSIGFENLCKKAAEFGGGDGFNLSNIRHLKENHNFEIKQIDCESKNPDVIKAFITAENINEIFENNNINELDLLSIDIDGNDYWVWKSINIKPKVVVVEYNNNVDLEVAKTIKYNKEHVFKNNDYYGASWLAFKKLGESKGYKLARSNRLNMFFVAEEFSANVVINDMKPITFRGWPPGNGEWIYV